MPTDAVKKEEEKNLNPPAYSPERQEDKDTQDFLKKRIPLLKEVRKKALPGIDENIENIWADVDREFTPHLLGVSEQRARFEADEDNGLRSRLVKVGSDDQWQSDSADPVFYTKVVTALSVLLENNPEAVFIPAGSKYQNNTKVAYANWKASWENSNAKQQMKLFIFNMAKYGTAYGKTYPKLIVTNKKIRTEYHKDDASKNKYEEKSIIKFNDLCRKNINPWRVWMSESTRPGDSLSTDDWYYEEDYSWETFKEEFKDSPNFDFVKKGSYQEGEADQAKHQPKMPDTVTVGYYENHREDKFAIWVPTQNIPLYHSPLPNDDGMMSVWTAPWSLRHDESHYGIGIFEIIRQDAATYDRMKNMTVDQLTLSIYKMFFHKGLDQLGQNGKLVVSPGQGEQVSDPQSIKFLEIPGPGSEAWNGIKYLQDKIDSNSGVPQQLTGRFTGNTLGQDLQAKELALERMKTPLDFLLDALQQEGYISLSWLKQLLTTPEILEWNTPEELSAALKEAGMSDEDIQMYLKEAQAPSEGQQLLYQSEPGTDEEGNPTQPKKYANVFKEIFLGLEQDAKGNLTENKNSKFYRFGLHIPKDKLDWRGMIRVKPQSVLAPSKELEKRSDLELYNLIFPSIQAMSANPMLVPVLLPPIKQILKVYEKNPDEWVNIKEFEQMYEAAKAPKPEAPPEVKTTISFAYKDMSLTPTEPQREALEKYLGIKIEEPLFIDGAGGAGGAGAADITAKAAPGPMGPEMPPEMGGEGEPAPEGEGGMEPPQIEPISPMKPTAMNQSESFAQQSRVV